MLIYFISPPNVSDFHNSSSMNTHSQISIYKKKRHILLLINKVRTVHSYLSFNKCLYIMFKIFMLSKIIIILITFANNTFNVHVNDLTYFFFFSFIFFFFEKAIYTAIDIE